MKRMNFRNKLLLYIIPTTVIGIVAQMIVVYTMSSSRIMSTLEQNILANVQQTERELNDWLGERRREAEILGATEIVAAVCNNERFDEAERFLTTYLEQSPQLENLFVAAPSGLTLLDGVGGAAVGLALAEMPEYKSNVDQSRAGNFWMSDVQVSPVTGRPVVLITVPVKKNGSVIGIVGTPVELMEFSSRYIAENIIGESGFTYLLDGSGTVLAHPQSDQILNTDMSELEYGRDILSLKNGTITYDLNDSEQIAYFVTHPTSGWTIVATASVDEYLASIHSLRLLSIVIGILLSGLILAIIWIATAGAFTTIQRTATGLADASNQLNSASGLVSGSSQSLSEHASEQASSIEETSSSLMEISSQANHNAENANLCNDAMMDVGKSFENIDANLTKLVDAVSDIDRNSQDTQKIIKTIDEIAFQTNLLALNAAVEAARAGEAGLGFAVVAEEVRNLSQRAAEAAKNTQTLIEKTVVSVRNGTGLMQNVQQAITENREIGNRVMKLVAEISAAATEQAQGVNQVSTAVSQLDQLTQSIAANAEEAASTSEELSAQANDLNVYIDSLAMLIGRNGTIESIEPGTTHRILNAAPSQRLEAHRPDKESFHTE